MTLFLITKIKTIVKSRLTVIVEFLKKIFKKKLVADDCQFYILNMASRTLPKVNITTVAITVLSFSFLYLEKKYIGT